VPEVWSSRSSVYPPQCNGGRSSNPHGRRIPRQRFRSRLWVRNCTTFVQKLAASAHTSYAAASKDGTEIMPLPGTMLDGGKLHKYYKDERDNRCGIIYLTGFAHDEEFRLAVEKRLRALAKAEHVGKRINRAASREIEREVETCVWCLQDFASKLIDAHENMCSTRRKVSQSVSDHTIGQLLYKSCTKVVELLYKSCTKVDYRRTKPKRSSKNAAPLPSPRLSRRQTV
jgi:hypothetical protein